MALPNGIYKGKGLVFTVAGTDYDMDVKSVSLTSEEKETVTFADVTAGNRQWTLTATAMFDAGTGSLWRYVWDNAGSEGVTFTVETYGNATATTAQPHITGTLTIPNKPDWSTEAGTNSEIEIVFEVEGEPTLAIA